MSRREALRLRDIREAIATIRRHLAEATFDLKTSDAVLYRREAAPEMPWTKIVGLRNLLAHEYFRIDLAIWRSYRRS